MMWPFLSVYMGFVGTIINGLKIHMTIKKMLRFLFLVGMSLPFNRYLAVIILSYGASRITGVVACSFYGYFALMCGFSVYRTISFLTYIILNTSYRVVAIGILPLPVFILKTVGLIPLYIVMMISLFIFVE
jgi:hypothetical protein